jgi:outer membrane protein
MPDSAFRPYVGVGLNFTIFSSVNLAIPAVSGVQSTAVPLDLNSTSVGIAGQLGADWKVADHWLVNADAKYVQLSTDVKVKASGTKITKVTADPWVLGVGIGYRF